MPRLAPQREDLFGVAVDDLAHLREHQTPPLSFEQLLPERTLERTDLRAHGRVRERELAGCLRHATLARHQPEVEQVVVVQPIHALSICRNNLHID